jgi:molecular chaperone Hsp33
MTDSPASNEPTPTSAGTPIQSRPSASPDQLVRTISDSGTIGVKALLGSELVAEALGRRPHTPTAGNALGRAMLGALLIAVGSAADDANEANTESVQLQFRGDGPLGSLTAIADSRAVVRGTVQHPEVSLVLSDNTPDIARAIGLGPLNVVRHRPRWRSPYTGTVPLVSGEVAGDLTLYLTESEQTPSAMGLGVSFGPGMVDVGACGFLVQALPGATDEELALVEENVAGLPGLATLLDHPITPDDLIDRLLIGLGSRARHTMLPRFYCPCNHERALRTLSLLERSEVLQMIEKQEGQEVVCDFCGKDYQISPTEMSPILEFQNERT